jgi:V8-like Glu-specific endopeptidase
MNNLKTKFENDTVWGQFALSIIIAASIGCGEIESVASAHEMEPITNVVMQPIRYGNLDNDGHPGVLRLYIQVGNSGFLCSGTVIEQRTILTAAHCVDNAASAADVYVVIDGNYTPAAGMWIHEQYSANAAHLRNVDGAYYRFSGPDLALITFAEDLPAPVVSLGMDSPAQNDLLTIVGFGSDENENTGVRRVGQVSYQTTTETYLENQETVDNAFGSLVVNPGPNNDLVCGGDSGGALLMGDTLVGVTSGGVLAVGDDNPCVRSRSANFISPAAYIDWIESKIALPNNEQAEISNEMLCAALNLDSTNAFATPGNFAANWGGLNEKWFRNGEAQWYYILPTGAVYQWNVGSTPPTGNLAGSLSPDFHNDPTLLTEAVEPNDGCAAPAIDPATLPQSAFDLDETYDFRFNGSYATNWAGLGEKWIIGGNNNWFFILPNGEINRWTNGTRPVIGESIGQLSADYHGDPALLHEAQEPGAADDVCADNSVESTAFDLDQTYGFRFTGSYAEGWGGQGEKWFQNSTGRWFFIVADGNIYRWTSNTQPAEGTLVGTLSAAYHVDPMLLLEAPQPVGDCGTVDGLASEAASLDSSYQFSSNGSYSQDWAGENEKWFTNVSNNWFYILPNGVVYRWQVGTRPLEGTLVGELDATYWANPELLHDAAQ